jgi:hypothetical protein
MSFVFEAHLSFSVYCGKIWPLGGKYIECNVISPLFELIEPIICHKPAKAA